MAVSKSKPKAKTRKQVRGKRATSPSASGRRKAATQNEPEHLVEGGLEESRLEQQISGFVGGLAELTSSALRFAGKTRHSASKAISRTPEQLRRMASAGDSLRDMREVLGLTASEISETLMLKDRNVWEAIEDGREVLSLELILRLASLYARNDPLPFVFKYLRTYQPRLWSVIHELGVDQFSALIERERLFINIYRSNDAARKISDVGFSRVLKFTEQAFELALGYVAEEEEIPLKPAAREKTKQSRGKKPPLESNKSE